MLVEIKLTLDTKESIDEIVAGLNRVEAAVNDVISSAKSELSSAPKERRVKKAVAAERIEKGDAVMYEDESPGTAQEDPEADIDDAAEEPAPVQKKKPVKQAEAATIEHVIAALRDHAAKHGGREKTNAILGKFGVKNVNVLDKSKYDLILKDLRK